MTILLILGALFVGGAAAAFVMAARIATRNRIRHWNGDEVSVSESHKQHARVQRLRLMGGVFIILVLIDLVAVVTLANYAGTR